MIRKQPMGTTTISESVTPIRMFDYVEQYAGIREEMVRAIEGVLESGSLVLGEQVERFEHDFAHYLAGGGHGVGVGNGTDALAIALRAVGVRPGDEVITVANTAVATVSAIRMCGATPVFCDIDPETLLIDLDSAEACVTEQTEAIVPVHLFGSAVDMPAVMRLAARHGLTVIEDCAQSCGTTWNGHMTGTFGDVGCFSFYPTKNLGAYGDGGLCFTRDKHLADTMRQLRSYGCDAPFDCRREGVNSRLDELQAAVLGVKLRHLDGWLARRRAIGRLYEQLLLPAIERRRNPSLVDPSYHLFVIAVDDRDTLLAELVSAQIGYGIHYPRPIHLMEGYAFLGYQAGSLPITEQMAERIVSLPCYPELSEAAVRRVASVVNLATQAGTHATKIAA